MDMDITQAIVKLFQVMTSDNCEKPNCRKGRIHGHYSGHCEVIPSYDLR